MGWVTYVLDVAVLCIIAAIGLGVALYKQRQYQKVAEVCIQGIVRKITGHKVFYIKECLPTARSIQLGGGTYLLHPERKKWGRYPAIPFFGIKQLQVPIREEIWDENNIVPARSSSLDAEKGAEPVESPDRTKDASGNLLEADKWLPTAMEIQAEINQIQAVETSINIQEQKDMFDNSIKAIANQPNKTIVYALLVTGIIFGISTLVVSLQLGGVI